MTHVAYTGKPMSLAGMDRRQSHHNNHAHNVAWICITRVVPSQLSEFIIQSAWPYLNKHIYIYIYTQSLRIYNDHFLSPLLLIPLLGWSSFLYIVAWIASQLSTWRTFNPSLDTCPIITLLVVVEYAGGCGGTV